MQLDKIEFERCFTFAVPTDTIGAEGQALILDLVADKIGVGPGKNLLAFLPRDWSWDWKVLRGTYAGTLSKRLQNFVYKKFGAKLDSATVSEVGNLAQRYADKPATYHFDFNRTLNWERGDFSDSKSCFWGGQTAHRDLIRALGGFAIRLYNDPYRGVGDEENPPRRRGIGRAWIIPFHSKYLGYVSPPDAEPEMLIVFNGYGLYRKEYQNIVYKDEVKQYGEMQTLDYARLLANWLGVSYQPIQISVNGKFGENSELYVNNDGLSAVAVGPVEIVRQYKVPKYTEDEKRVLINFPWGETFLAGVRHYCNSCHNYYYGTAEEVEFTRFSNYPEAVCRTCARLKGTVCAHCEKPIWVPKAHAIRVYGQPDLSYLYYCTPDHARKHEFRCVICDTWVHQSTRMFLITSLLPPSKSKAVLLEVCRSCFNSREPVLCDSCGRPFDSALVPRKRGATRCPACQGRKRGGADLVVTPYQQIAPADLQGYRDWMYGHRRDLPAQINLHDEEVEVWQFNGGQEIPHRAWMLLNDFNYETRVKILKTFSANRGIGCRIVANDEQAEGWIGQRLFFQANLETVEVFWV